MKQRSADCRVLVLTAYRDSGTVLGMLKGSAGGYLLKDGDPSVIHEALRAVTRVQTWISQAISAQLVSLASEETATLGDTLTQREQEVLNLIVKGKSNLEIGQELSLAERTVEFHVSNLLQKLGVRSRVEAVIWVKDHGIY